MVSGQVVGDENNRLLHSREQTLDEQSCKGTTVRTKEQCMASSFKLVARTLTKFISAQNHAT